jgi:hypothetical protein
MAPGGLLERLAGLEGLRPHHCANRRKRQTLVAGPHLNDTAAGQESAHHPISGHGRICSIERIAQCIGSLSGFDSQAGQLRYRHDYESGKVGKTVESRSGRNMPPYRPRRIFDREEVLELQRRGLSLRKIAKQLGLGLGTVSRTLQS